jgi:hypothetical protein
MNETIYNSVLELTGAKSLTKIEEIQSLWSGYGSISRYSLQSASIDSIIIKQIQLNKMKSHPRGWSNQVGHQRKIKSYQVECSWYQDYNQSKDQNFRTAKCYGILGGDPETFILLEDLDAAGYPVRITHPSWASFCACIKWLASFHAHHLQVKPISLWEIGTYWHLQTRPEELKQLKDIPLKRAAYTIDQILNNSTYKTLVHGDAKIANFCFSESCDQVAAVDFQYIGAGCGMKDLAYFTGSCMQEIDAEKKEASILNYYFDCFREESSLDSKEIDFLEKEWRSLYSVAWVDFQRFLKGWCPDHWKINQYSDKLQMELLRRISNQ